MCRNRVVSCSLGRAWERCSGLNDACPKAKLAVGLQTPRRKERSTERISGRSMPTSCVPKTAEPLGEADSFLRYLATPKFVVSSYDTDGRCLNTVLTQACRNKSLPRYGLCQTNSHRDSANDYRCA